VRTSNLEWSNINSVLNSDSCSKTWRFNTLNKKVWCLMVTTINNVTDPQAQYTTAAVVSSASIALISSTVKSYIHRSKVPGQTIVKWPSVSHVLSWSREMQYFFYLLQAQTGGREGERRLRYILFVLHPI